MNSPAFYAEVRALRLERVLDVSVEIISEAGWDGLSMSEVARRSGIPRQTVYKDVGSRAALGRAVVDRELARFMELVRAGLAAHPDSMEDGLAAAVRGVLEHARGSTILAAVLRPGHDPGLLSLVTVHPDAVLGQATDALASLLGEGVPLALVDSVVRLTLSHLLQPTVSVDDAVDRIMCAARGFA
ncbi:MULTISPECIES: TetR family transcriptional regulator [Gordonia]|uniref:TetR family transcriptional regulator n=1 Tax=Gordonia sp. 852002-10350_SCH5691597 TaxID=1834085 RepID=UPI0007E96058|nr:TetR family transcriptional regulator [Gordonia sp. 852002-10350_SCH5691597]OBA66774.1 TetR family transcriptional regulator [Gordonia sp. 852002-10350_SCH5691597]